MDPQSNEEDDRPKWDETPELLALKELVNRRWWKYRLVGRKELWKNIGRW